MKKWFCRRSAGFLFASGILALEILLLADGVIVLRGGETPPAFAAAALIFMTAILIIFRRHCRRWVGKTALMIPTVVSVAAVCVLICWNIFSSGATYRYEDSGKHQIYGDRRVMLIVPHQDDELNILGGVLEEYLRYGSELFPVYVTNGDYHGIFQTRYEEALRVFETMGVNRENVIFLGYGDSWKADGPHIYNAEPGVTVESHFGKTRTYGTQTHPAYREGRQYTIENLMADLESVILEYNPDVIFCSDYDHNIDHKSTTLLFEKVMGRILKNNPEYRPVVYKAYAYGTAWEAQADYYADNVLSTKNPFAEPYSQKPAVYRWEDRVRFPVDGTTLSRSLMGSGAYKQLGIYSSQGAQAQAARVVNGDRVAWRRYTDSLCLNAEISVSSGDRSLLNDFMLLENSNLVDETHKPYDGVWIPDRRDSEKTATVVLANAGSVCSLVLYDHPSEEYNVLNARIRFDDGTSIETGALDPSGAATLIPVNKEMVSSFAVELTRVQGDSAGLSEIEAFAREPEKDGRFIKLTDRDGNFLYDYQTAEDGYGELLLYIHGNVSGQAGYSVSTVGGSGTATLKDGVICVYCPVGESITVQLTCSEGGLSDSITVRNPGKVKRVWNAVCSNAEKAVFTCYSEQGHKRLLIPNTITKLIYVIKHIM